MVNLTFIKKLSMATAGAAFITLGAMGAAQAQVTIAENGDAGQTLDTAQQIPSGAATLNSIVGTISSPDEADLYSFFIQDPAAFSATTVGGVPANSALDPQLFLFDANGFGVEANDDVSSATLDSTLPAGNQFSPTQPGVFFLGISDFDNDPLSAGGEIFDDTIDQVVGPTGPGGGSPLINFDGNGDRVDTGSYEISLTGANAVNAVPEPSSVLGFLTIGVFGAGAMVKRRWKKCKN